ncbi:MAG TPA: phosphopyruvate hydratase, partial [Candidatus Binatus sp.]|nr:phosphopyruvate hydratase [Candidatus Binatus sp.]
MESQPLTARENYKIEKIFGREVLDSRGNPTVQADVYTRRGFGRFTVPSGASKGRFEARELRDLNHTRYGGLGVQTAIRNITEVIGPVVKEFMAHEQEKIDRVMIDLDGTEMKEHLGANAILAVSVAVARAAADTGKLPFYQHVNSTWGKGRPLVLPVPMMNIINGGKHAGNDLAFQEFMILPVGLKTFTQALAAGSEIYHTLGKMLGRKYGKSATNVGDEGGYAPSVKTIREALDSVEVAIRESGYASGREVVIGIDPASGSFYDYKSQTYSVDGEKLSVEKLGEFYNDLVRTYPLRSIEDPF